MHSDHQLYTDRIIVRDEAKRRKAVLLAVVLAFFGFLSSDMYLPMMPAMTQSMHTSTHLMQLSVGVYLLGLCVAQLVFGPLSDRVGRRPLILWGMALMALGSFVCALSWHIGTFLWGRALTGVGAAGGLAMARVVARDCYRGAKLATVISGFSLVVGLAPALAPVLGALLGQYAGWHMIFVCLVAVYVVLWCAFWCLFPETRKQVEGPVQSVCSGLKILLRARMYLAGCAIATVLFGAYMAYMTAAPFIFQEHFHYSLHSYTMVVVGMVMASLLGRVCNVLLLRRFSVYQVVHLGISCVCVATVALLLQSYMAESALGCLSWLMLFVMACGMVFANVFVSAMDGVGESVGLAGALYGAIQMSGSFVGSLLVAWMPEHSMVPLAWLMVLASAMVAVVFYFSFSPMQPLPSAMPVPELVPAPK